MRLDVSTIRVGVGRELTVYDAGARDGPAVVAHHGTPDSGAPFAVYVRDAETDGVRLVSYERAGYADSTRRPGRSVGEVAEDVSVLADALGLGTFATWGHSGGGPHALATAALLPKRVTAVASVAGVAPYDAEGLDWTAGMGEQNVKEFDAVLGGEERLRPALEAEAEGLRALDIEQLVEALSTLLPPADVAVLSGAFGAWKHAGFRRALSTGVDGWVDDDLAFVAPWGFDVADVRVPALLVQGRTDLMVPHAHADWLAAHLPRAEQWRSDGDGHLTVVAPDAVRRLHAWLLSAR